MEAIWYKKILSLNPKYGKKKLFHIWGGGGSWGALRQTQVNENFRAVIPHHRADICVTREKNNHQVFIYRPQYIYFVLHFWLFGGPRWSIKNRTGPILLASYPLTYINLHIWNMEVIRSGFLKLSCWQRNVCGRGVTVD